MNYNQRQAAMMREMVMNGPLASSFKAWNRVPPGGFVAAEKQADRVLNQQYRLKLRLCVEQER